jgi:glutamate synthase (NADPH/NADH) small chain
MGLGGVNALDAKGEDAKGVADAVDFIADLRQAKDLGKLAIGRRVVVIGGGMTAIDAAIQSKLLGAEEVTICYRRGAEAMKASRYEQELAASKGVTIRHWLAPKRIHDKKGKLRTIELEYTEVRNGKLKGSGETIEIACDQVFKAIGQMLVADDLGVGGRLELERGKIRIDKEGCTSLAGVWAGGDCSSTGDDLTVSAVAQGRDAAESIHRALAG